MVKIHEFDPVVYPFKPWICAKKDESVLKEFRLYPYDVEIVQSENDDATTRCVYSMETKNIGILIDFLSKKHMDVKTIAHEARHAGDMLFELIGDNPHHSEPASYYTGWVAECIDKVKKGK